MVAVEIRKEHGFPQPQQNRNQHNISSTPYLIDLVLF